MRKKKSIKLELTVNEKTRLKANKIKISEVQSYAADELSQVLHVPLDRAVEFLALAEFQKISSIGIRFAQDLVSMGYHSIDQLKDKNGAKLTEDFEVLKGYWIDPCVEDQFRLAVYYANTADNSKNWWDFTAERKKYRLEKGYPPNRPIKPWYEAAGLIPKHIKKAASVRIKS